MAMKYRYASAFIFVMSLSSHCSAVAPVGKTEGPPGSVEMQVHSGRVHEIYVTRPASMPPHIPGRLKVSLSRGVQPNEFRVDLAYVELPDGRIYFRVDTPKGEESDYDIWVMDMLEKISWYVLFSGKLSDIPIVQESRVK
jgi:hypothetical protein